MTRAVKAQLSKRDAQRLRPLVEQLAAQQDSAAQIAFDPLEFPSRYSDLSDVEAVGLIAASMAYGRASVFKPCIESVLNVMGPHPATFARAFARSPSVEAFNGIRYRFNQPPDYAALVAGIGWTLNEHGSLGRRFGQLFELYGLREGLSQFARELRTTPPVARVLRERGPRGIAYLLTDPSVAGAAKRWHLYLRWMVRGPDGVDLGTWRKLVPKAALLIPLDTHVARIAHYLRLTRRTDLSWRTAEEVTASLRMLDPRDPVRFDFVLCHHGMSGKCPPRVTAAHCQVCPLRSACVVGLRNVPASSPSR